MKNQNLISVFIMKNKNQGKSKTFFQPSGRIFQSSGRKLESIEIELKEQESGTLEVEFIPTLRNWV